MGIRYLNSFLKKTCRNSIRRIHLGELSSKRIVIDVSIYLYQFEGDGMLLDKMKRFITVLNEYNIQPLFVFDGKPPVEKMSTICHRREQRRLAAIECEDVVMRIKTNDAKEDNHQLTAEYIKLRRSSAEITRDKTDSVKQLFDEYNVPYCTAPSEADTICASMVLTNEFWGCMSDDMDMLVYGCRNIIRDLDIESHTARLYVLPDILQELNITYDNFKRVCVIAGTDYNTYHQKHYRDIDSVSVVPCRKPLSDERDSSASKMVVCKNTYIPFNATPTNITFYAAIKLFERYQHTVKYPTMTFYGWLKHYLKLNLDYISLEKVYNMFCVPSNLPMIA
jgi:hypothetical protein